MNKTILVGRLTKDIELKRNQGGSAMVNFNVAVNRKVSTGEKPQADFISCVAWNKTAELMAQYLNKGAQIGIDGRIHTRSYDKNGTRIYVTEVVAERVEFLSAKGEKSASDEIMDENVYEASNDVELVAADEFPWEE